MERGRHMDWKDKQDLEEAIAKGIQKYERERRRKAPKGDGGGGGGATGGGSGGGGGGGAGGGGGCGFGGLVTLAVIAFLIYWLIF